MSDGGLTECVVGGAALAWLESLGYVVKRRLDIAPGHLQGEYCGTGGRFGRAGRF